MSSGPSIRSIAPRRAWMWPGKILSRFNFLLPFSCFTCACGGFMRHSAFSLSSIFFLVICLTVSGFATAQQNKPAEAPPRPPAPLLSPEVHDDGSVTFRFRDPNAKEVMVARAGAQPGAVKKGDDG